MLEQATEEPQAAKVKPNAFKKYLSEYRENKIAEGYQVGGTGDAIDISAGLN